MKKAVILDPAHGKNTPGKRSPDQRHKEYFWSRGRIAEIVNEILKVKELGFDLHYPFLYYQNEPGLTARGLKYNSIAKDYDKTFVLSLHNDAQRKDQCNAEGWGKANGISVWTSKGDDNSDPHATSLYNHLVRCYPNETFRSAYWRNKGELTKDPDWEADFTMLAGNANFKPNYDAVLLEFLFQTNFEDVEKLLNPIHHVYFVDKISEWIINEFK